MWIHLLESRATNYWHKRLADTAQGHLLHQGQFLIWTSPLTAETCIKLYVTSESD